jgi:hypothetical protein
MRVFETNKSSYKRLTRLVSLKVKEKKIANNVHELLLVIVSVLYGYQIYFLYSIEN